ncbi:hypothetical protein QBC34DRAFT_411875 [Podospora aff. communis PSN243]|uniref:Uncharacterized protein n=1 Tax=Podospora aff. communis PSN243 TaxID=3040156 RepID=A0AAV9GG95_9PEZI|nr:hypothetical protein QBC34DRAFT_411875 [Podospora aff. communis PSN243]
MQAKLYLIVTYAAALAAAATAGTTHAGDIFARAACNAQCTKSTLGATCLQGASCCTQRCRSACGQRTGRCEGFLSLTCVCYN